MGRVGDLPVSAARVVSSLRRSSADRCGVLPFARTVAATTASGSELAGSGLAFKAGSRTRASTSPALENPR